MKFWQRQPNDLELELREGRPLPSAALETRVLEQLAARAPLENRSRRRNRSLALAFVVVAAAFVASIGGVSYAASGTVDVASTTAQTVTKQTTAVVKVVKHAVKPSKDDKPKVTSSSPSSDQYHPDKVTICHTTGSGSVTITIARSALPAHLAHGDTIGPCTS